MYLFIIFQVIIHALNTRFYLCCDVLRLVCTSYGMYTQPSGVYKDVRWRNLRQQIVTFYWFPLKRSNRTGWHAHETCNIFSTYSRDLATDTQWRYLKNKLWHRLVHLFGIFDQTQFSFGLFTSQLEREFCEALHSVQTCLPTRHATMTRTNVDLRFILSNFYLLQRL